MIETLSNKLAIMIKEAAPHHSVSKDVLKFSIESIINTIVTIIIALTISLIFSNFVDTLIVLLSFALLRAISGGYHLSSSMACIIVTSLVANIIPFISLSNAVFYVLILISMILTLCFAPSNIEQQTRIPRRFFIYLKFLSFSLIALNLIVNSDIIAVTYLVQSLLLIKVGR